MPGLRKNEIIHRIKKYLINNGAIFLSEALSGPAKKLPWQMRIKFNNSLIREYCIYIWTIGHGGRTRSQKEYRIQTKLDYDNELKFSKGTTILLGYYNEKVDQSGKSVGNEPPGNMEIIVAWDPLEHLKLGLSSSCQVSFDLMEKAYYKGISSFVRRLPSGSFENIIAIRPEYIISYLLEAAGGHKFVTSDSILKRYVKENRTCNLNQMKST